MDYKSTSEVIPDAVPYPDLTCYTTEHPLNVLDTIIEELSLEDYRSIFFLLMDSTGPANFLYFVNQDRDYLKDMFRNKYYEFPYKEAMLIEILGTMQKFSLLALFQTCQHIFENEKESFSQIGLMWKCLYSVCEQLSNSQVADLKEKLLPDSHCVITCAEQLFCEAFLAGVFNSCNLTKLTAVFENDYPDCLKIITAYKKKAKLSFYPVKRPTRKSPCGHAVIICHKNFQKANAGCPDLTPRYDSHIDIYALKELWDSFGFKTSIHIDFIDTEVISLFKSLSKEDHSSYDAFVACYLSHGDKGIVYASNSKPIAVGDLIDIMANNCPSLVGKPKMFFVQACQGDLVQEGVYNYDPPKVYRNSIDVSYSKLCMNTPIFTDVLLVMSSIDGYASLYPPGKNSWFIAALVSVMKEEGEDLTLLNAIIKVSDIVAQRKGETEDRQHKNCKQTIVTNVTLRRELKLKKMQI